MNDCRDFQPVLNVAIEDEESGSSRPAWVHTLYCVESRRFFQSPIC